MQDAASGDPDPLQGVFPAQAVRQLEKEATTLKSLKNEVTRQLHVLQVDEAALLAKLWKLRGVGKATAELDASSELGSADDDASDADEAEIGQLAADIELQMEMEVEGEQGPLAQEQLLDKDLAVAMLRATQNEEGTAGEANDAVNGDEGLDVDAL